MPIISRGTLSPIEGRSEDFTSYSSFVIQDSNHPRWEESFCVRLPNDITFDTQNKGPIILHVSVEKIDQKKVKEFAHGQVTLADNFNGVILDGSHEVQCAGLKAQGLKKVTDRALQKEERSGTVQIRTSLSSTHVVRNQHLARLFQWKIMSPGELLEMLARLPSAHEELGGFIPETLDTLFALLDTVDDEHVAVAVVSVLSFVIDQVCDERRSKDIRSLLLAYSDGPRCTLSKRGAVRLHRAMAVYFGTYRSRPAAEVAYVVGSLDILHRLMARGRGSSAPLPPNVVDDPRQNTLQITSGFKGLMTEQDPVYFSAQVLVLVKLETLTNFFKQFMSSVEVSTVVVSVLSAVPTQSTWSATVQLDESASPVLIARVVNEHLRSIVKLEFIERVVSRGNEGLLGDSESRGLLWPSLLDVGLKHLIPLTEKSTEVDEDALHYTSSLFQRMISLVQKGSGWEYLRPSLLRVLPSLFELWESIQQWTDSVTLICDVAIVILALLYVTTAAEFTNYVAREIAEHSKQQSLLTQLCLCLSSMITRRRSGSPFPSQWKEFIALQLRSTHLTVLNVKALVSNSPILALSKPVMAQYLQLLFAFVNSPHVRVDGQQQLQISSKKSTAEMAEELMTLVTPTWKGLSPADQVDVVDNILGPVLKASLIFNPASIGQRAGALFQAMLQRCVSQTGQENRIRTHIVRTIIQDFAVFYVPRSRGRPKEFVAGWLQKLILEPPPDSTILEVPLAIKQRLIEDMNVLVSVVAEIEGLPQEKWLDHRIARTHFLLDHLKQLGETNDYIRILQVLYELHKKAGNLAQAAHALQLNIELVPFDEDKFVDALNDLPKQSCSERRIELMRRAIDLFSRAKLFEEALELCGPLCEHLRRRYRMPELAEALATQSALVKGTMASPRLQPQYWFLSFTGDKLADWVRDKEFVYVNYSREQASDMFQRLRNDYPDSRIVNVFLSRQELLNQQQSQGSVIQAVPIISVLNPSTLLSKCSRSVVDSPESLKNWIQSIYPNRFCAIVRPEPTQEYEHVISVLNHFPSLLSLVPVDVHSVSGPKFITPSAAGRTASPPPVSIPANPVGTGPSSPVGVPTQSRAIGVFAQPQPQQTQFSLSPASSSSSPAPSVVSSPGSISGFSSGPSSAASSLSSSSGSIMSIGSPLSTGSSSSTSPPPQQQFPSSPLMFSIGSTNEPSPMGPPQALTPTAPFGAAAKLPPASTVVPQDPQRANPPSLVPANFRPMPLPDPTRSTSPLRPPSNANSPSVVPVAAKVPPTSIPSRIQVKLDGPRMVPPPEPSPQQPMSPPVQQPPASAPVATSPALAQNRPLLPGMAPATPLQLRSLQPQPPQ